MSQENTQSVDVKKEEIQVEFKDFNFKHELQKSIDYAGFKIPSPIQAQAIPVISEGRDVVGQAHTGTGKTAAFGLPTMNKMKNDGSIEALVITPTRELANQVSDELYKFGRNIGIRTVTIYGGSSYNRQLDLISRGAGIIVATPGRLKDMLSRGMLKNFNPSTVILDEADEMLDMGFLDDINEIFEYLPKERQTMPAPIKALASRSLVEPEFISITKGETTNKDITQTYYVIEEKERDDAIIRLLDANETNKIVVFCRTKREVDRLSNVLSSVGYNAKGLHGDMEQRTRESVIKGLKDGQVDILIATDVAARGIHIDDVSHVINFHIPFDPESYVHRIGRTGRAGTKGNAITLVTPMEFKELQRIKKVVGTSMEHAFIPSKSDVKTANMDKLVTSVESQKVYDEAHVLLDALKNDLDSEQILYKLASLLIDKQNIKGPNEIGINKDRLEKILQNVSRHGGGGRNRNYRGRRNGGGGGYRGNRSGGNRDGGGHRRRERN